MKLGKRLSAICEIVPKCEVVADIGTDHGFVLENLLKSGKVNKAIASDISSQSLEKAKTLLEVNAFKNKCKFFVCDGFSKLEKEKIDIAIISGMGADEIIKILKANQNPLNSFILSPNKYSEKLRLYLINSHYRIIKDFVVEENGKFYFVLQAKKMDNMNYQKLTKKEKFFGRTNLKKRSEDFYKYIDYKKQSLESHSKFFSSEELQIYKLCCTIKESR